MRQVISYFKTMILFAGLTGLVMALCYILGGRNALYFGFLFAVVLNFGAYWFSDKMVLAGTGAQQIDRTEAPQLYDDVNELRKKMNLPMPKLYIIDEIQPNAFATGRNPNHSVVAVTRGLMENLERDEMRGVLAHELGHIKNYDILISSVAAVFAGAISSIGDLFFWTGFMGGNNDDDDNPMGAFGGILMMIIAPIAAMLIQFAISRTREYEADATAAQYTKDPKALASALIKIERIATQRPMRVNPAYAGLFIQNPFQLKGVMELFSTHPLTEKRISHLMRLQS